MLPFKGSLESCIWHEIAYIYHEISHIRWDFMQKVEHISNYPHMCAEYPEHQEENCG